MQNFALIGAAGYIAPRHIKAIADIEKACVACVLGGNGVPSVKISRVVEALEKASGLTELNMPDTIALEYFMLSSLRIWTR